MKKIGLLILIAVNFAGCAGKVNYRPPSLVQETKNTLTVASPRGEVWKLIIPALSGSFFVINNLDKDSGLISVSYSGSPEKYIDCGYIESYVKNARGERHYNFPAAKAYVEYETFENGTTLLGYKRKMNLEGRINIVVQETSAESTLITVNIRYVVTKSGTVFDINGNSKNFSDSISFNTNGSASFDQGTICSPTGVLESEVLRTLNL